MSLASAGGPPGGRSQRHTEATGRFDTSHLPAPAGTQRRGAKQIVGLSAAGSRSRSKAAKNRLLGRALSLRRTGGHLAVPAQSPHSPLANRSVLYHRKRQAFCELADTWSDVDFHFMGSGVVALAMQDSYSSELLVGIAIVAMSVLKLKLGIGRQAGTHKQLKLAFINLREELEDADDDDVIRKIRAQRADLENSEPPAMQVLNVICHNELLVSIGRDDPKERVPVSWFQHFAANLFSFSKTRFAKGT